MTAPEVTCVVDVSVRRGERHPRLGPGAQQPGVARWPGHRGDVGRGPRRGRAVGGRRVGDAARQDRRPSRCRRHRPPPEPVRSRCRSTCCSEPARPCAPTAPTSSTSWCGGRPRRPGDAARAARPPAHRRGGTAARGRRGPRRSRPQAPGGLGELAAVRRRLAGADPGTPRWPGGPASGSTRSSRRDLGAQVAALVSRGPRPPGDPPSRSITEVTGGSHGMTVAYEHALALAGDYDDAGGRMRDWAGHGGAGAARRRPARVRAALAGLVRRGGGRRAGRDERTRRRPGGVGRSGRPTRSRSGSPCGPPS